jgi:uncharacterized protein (UPF0218 family)
MGTAKLLRLKEAYREVLRVPLGLSLYREPRVSARLLMEITSLIKPPLVITVGDFVTENLVREGLEPNVVIVDFRTMREGYSSGLLETLARRYNVLRCVNPPGTLTAEAVNSVSLAVKESMIGSRVMVVAEGEEDLLALPAIVAAPPRSLVIYGLWLGASVAVVCHPLIRRSVEQFMEKAFEPLG